MNMRSSVRLAGLLALVVVATSACASTKVKQAKQEQAVANAEWDKINREASLDGPQKRADYVECVMDDAKMLAMDPDSDAIAPGDLADASLARCGSHLRSSQDDFSLELLSGGQDVASAAATASRTTEAVRASARRRAVAVIVDARRERSSPPSEGGGPPGQSPPAR
jgi:hypothetical protein